jgi:hypothetical protein
MLKVLVQWPTLICRLRIKQFIEPWILVSLFSFLFKEKEKMSLEKQMLFVEDFMIESPLIISTIC